MTRAEVTRMFSRAEGLRDNPWSYFPALQRARAAMATWRTECPDEAKAEDDLRVKMEAKTATERREDYKASNIARGLD